MNENESNSTKFIDIYNELDEYMRRELCVNDDTCHANLIERMASRCLIFRNNQYDLKSYAQLRNAIVHNPRKKESRLIAEPHDEEVKKYEDLLNIVMKPAKAIDTIAVCAKDIYTATLNDIALNVINVMNEKVYTHIPIIKDGNLFGVFSENTILSYIASKGDIILEKEALINEFYEFIPIRKHKSEYFEFVNKDTLVVQIEEDFQKGLKDKKRLATIFITENGSENEKILGMVTSWDLAGYDRL